MAPKFVPGQTFRYRIESRTTNTGTTTTPIINPEGGTRSSLMIHLLVRLDVLSSSRAGDSGGTRLRATYEKSSAEAESDAFDPAQPSLSDQFAHLENQSVEFALASGGQLVDIKGLDDSLADRSAAQSALSILSGLLSSTEFPAAGIEIGQKWRSERPIEGAPFAGLAWRVESTYLRDEPCNWQRTEGDSANPESGVPEPCAVILSRFEISRSSSSSSDATPEDYRRNGLRVSGSWSGSGQSLDYVSLSTGLLVRSTETSDQQTDYQITSASTGSSIRRKGQIHAQSEITLAPASPPVSR